MGNERTELLRLNRRIAFVAEILAIMEGEGDESKAINLLHEAETDAKLEITTVTPFPPPPMLPEHLYERFIEKNFYNFLSHTNLALGAADASRILLIFADKFYYAWGIREWGYMIAKWANLTEWLGRRDWEFAEFTGGPSDIVIENYDYWSRTTMRILRAKSRRRVESTNKKIPELLDHLLTNPNQKIRHEAASTLGSLGTPEAKSALEKAESTLTDESILGDVRYYLSLPDF